MVAAWREFFFIRSLYIQYGSEYIFGMIANNGYVTPQFLLLKVVEDIRNSVDSNYLDQSKIIVENNNVADSVQNMQRRGTPM